MRKQFFNKKFQLFFIRRTISIIKINKKETKSQKTQKNQIHKNPKNRSLNRFLIFLKIVNNKTSKDKNTTKNKKTKNKNFIKIRNPKTIFFKSIIFRKISKQTFFIRFFTNFA